MKLYFTLPYFTAFKWLFLLIILLSMLEFKHDKHVRIKMKESVENRRKFIKYATALPLVSMFSLSGCGGGGSSSDSSDSSSSSSSTSTTETTTETTTASSEWSSGGTSLISVDYPDDSIFDTDSTCVVSLTDETTLGPCYFQDDTGEDISTGKTGLPMQLCLQVIDSACDPLSDYIVEVWHCDTDGVYSGDTSDSDDASSFAGSFCTGGDSDAQVSTWYRGQLTTDSAGRVNFKTCFPGWYSGRTIHIHFTVRHTSGTHGVTSQFCFTDALSREICTTHSLYSARGEQDTTLASGTDTVFPSSGYDEFVLNTEQNSDGTLLAYHTIQIA